MTLDTAVKITQISTPFVLACLGFLLNRSIQKHGQNLKLTSEFNTKWSDEFISRCTGFSDSITVLQHTIFNMHHERHTLSEKPKLKTDFNVLLKEINQAKYAIGVHSALVDNSQIITLTIDKIFEQASSNVEAVKSGGHVDFETIKVSQNKLYKELKELQKSILKL